MAATAVAVRTGQESSSDNWTAKEDKERQAGRVQDLQVLQRVSSIAEARNALVRQGSVVDVLTINVGDDELLRYKMAFDQYDLDRGGSIDSGEIGGVMDALGIEQTDKAVSEILKAVDVDRNGTVEFDEFVNAMVNRPATDRFAFLTKVMEQKVFGDDDREFDDSDIDYGTPSKIAWFGLLHPDTPTRTVYEIWQVFWLFYTVIMVPIRVGLQTSQDPVGTVGWWMDILCDVTFGTDLLISFWAYTTHERTGRLIANVKITAPAYLKGWFMLDFLACFPWEPVLNLLDNCSDMDGEELAGQGCSGVDRMKMLRMARILRFLKLMKMLRFRKSSRLVDLISLKIRTSMGIRTDFIWKLSQLLFLLFLMSHLFACLWLFIGKSDSRTAELYSENSGNKDWGLKAASIEQTWFDLAFLTENKTSGRADIYGQIEETKDAGGCLKMRDDDCAVSGGCSTTATWDGKSCVSRPSLYDQYVTSFYYIVVVFSSTGFGDIHPMTVGEKFFGTGLMLLSCFLYAYIIAVFTDIVANLRRDQSMFNSKMRSVGSYLLYLECAKELNDKVKAFYEHKFASKTLFNEGAIFKEVPYQLRVELVRHRFGTVLKSVPFFAGMRDELMVEICLMMDNYSALAGDTVVEKDSTSRDLLIVERGSLIAEDDNGEIVNTYAAGSFLGELAFLGMEKKTTVHVKAAGFSEVFVLSFEKMQPVLLKNRGLANRLTQYATLRRDIFKMLNEGGDNVQSLINDKMAEKSNSDKKVEQDLAYMKQVDEMANGDNSHPAIQVGKILHDCSRGMLEKLLLNTIRHDYLHATDVIKSMKA